MSQGHGYLVHDTVSDRKETYCDLFGLSPRRRVAWLEWCCRQCFFPSSKIHPQIAKSTYDLERLARHDSSGDYRLTLDVYFTFWTLVSQYKLDSDKALARLERMGKRYGHCR